MKFFKTIRFKLTAWYSSVLIILCLFFISVLNAFVTVQYMKDIPAERIHVPRRLLERSPFEEQVEFMEDLKNLQIEQIKEQRQEDLSRLRTISLISLAPLVFISCLGGYFIAGRMLKPLKRLNKNIAEMSAKSLDKKIKFEDTGDEISELIKKFNGMTGRLNVAFDLQKQFVENAAHELRTPLAAIKANLQASIYDKNTPRKELLDSIDVALKSSDFMQKLIEDLLLLSLIDRQVKFEKSDLRTLMDDICRQVEVLAREKSIILDLDYERGLEKVKLRANKRLFQRALMNILENAVKYSPRGSKIKLAVGRGNSESPDKRIEIKIKDYGQGIPRKDLPYIFERFYRVDKSRSRQSGSFGLGLAISKRIIEIHKGEVSVKSVEGKGSEFVISFNSR